MELMARVRQNSPSLQENSAREAATRSESIYVLLGLLYVVENAALSVAKSSSKGAKAHAEKRGHAAGSSPPRLDTCATFTKL